MAYRWMGERQCNAIQTAPAAPSAATGPALVGASSATIVDAFAHGWIVGVVPDLLVVPEGLEPIPHDGKGTLLAVSNPR